MKQFFITVLGVLVGGAILLLLPFFFLVAVAAAFGSSEEGPKEHTLLTLNMEDNISDRDFDSPSYRLRNMIGGGETAIGLNTMLENLADAAHDDNIDALLLTGESAGADFATLTELRKAIADFKAESGKPVYFFGKGFSNGTLYVASVADSVFIVPTGSPSLTGLTSVRTYYTKAAEKLGIGFDVIKHGKYKSAVEPYFRNSMSPEDREQTMCYMNTIWSEIRDSIATMGAKADSIDAFVDNLQMFCAKTAERIGLVSRLAYRDEVFASLKNTVGLAADKDFEQVALTDYVAKDKDCNDDAEQKVAVVYAIGEILDGSNKNDMANIYGDDLAATLREVREDTTIHAVVLRVNSPGGSALASDIIWREVVLLKQQKPVVVSMGGYAASGGYYISCAANRILAQPTTLTGSIGVFGMVPNGEKLMENLGLGQDYASTAKEPMMAGYRKLSKNQYNAIQASIEDTYHTFVNRVAEGRNKSWESVDSIGQGRVWAGKDAIGIGLVDEIGGMEDAIDVAAELAALSDYEIVEFPKIDDSPFAAVINAGMEMRATIGRSFIGDDYDKIARMREQMKSGRVSIMAECDVEVK